MQGAVGMPAVCAAAFRRQLLEAAMTRATAVLGQLSRDVALKQSVAHVATRPAEILLARNVSFFA
eukprot:364798-Chlamydomonas_euryale.AAC.4